MNEALKEQISAFVDGELSDHETELLLRRLAQDSALRDAVGQYMEIGRRLRREPEVPGMGDLRQRIAQALDGQVSGAVEPGQPTIARHFKPVAGMAVAASVAIVALIGLRQGDEIPDNPAGNIQAVADSNEIAYTVPGIGGTEQADPSEGLARFYRKHGATTTAMGSNDVSSRLVSFELLETGIEEPEPEPDDEEDIQVTPEE